MGYVEFFEIEVADENGDENRFYDLNVFQFSFFVLLVVELALHHDFYFWEMLQKGSTDVLAIFDLKNDGKGTISTRTLFRKAGLCYYSGICWYMTEMLLAMFNLG